MKRLFVGLLIGCFIFSIPVLAISEEPVFRLVDGYFQVEHCKPDHLIHQLVKKHFLYPSDDFRLWLTWTIEETQNETQNPYLQSKKRYIAEAELELVNRNIDGEKIVWKSFLPDYLYPYRGIFHWEEIGHTPREITAGDAVIRVRVKDEENKKAYYSFEIPIEIR